jgi:O-antigen/teichoic acid export membrane protein
MGSMATFANYRTSKNGQELKAHFYRLLKIVSIVFSVITVGLLTTSWFVIPFIFGSAYIPSIIPLLLLIPYMLSFAFSAITGLFLDYQGLATTRAIYLVVTIVLNVLLNLWLIPKYGAAGTAIATSISSIPYALLNLRQATGFINSPYSDHSNKLQH